MDQSQAKSVPADQATKNSYTAPSKNVGDTIIATDNLSTFAAAIEAVGLIDTLAAKGPFTVFAPTDAAFQKLPSGAYEALLRDSAKLRAVLSYHIIPGHLTVRDVKPREVMTLQGSTLTATVVSATVHVNGARIGQSDIVGTNGVVHAIDAVILPKGWQLLAIAA